MKGIDCLEFQGRVTSTDIGIVFLPLEIDISGVFRKGPCGNTRDDNLASSEVRERRIGQHAKNPELLACMGSRSSALLLAAIAIDQERGRLANLIQDVKYSLIKTAAMEPYGFIVYLTLHSGRR